MNGVRNLKLECLLSWIPHNQVKQETHNSMGNFRDWICQQGKTVVLRWTKQPPMLDINHGWAHHVIHDMLQFHKRLQDMCLDRWLPKWRKDPRTPAREHLQWYKTDGSGFLKCTVTGNKSLVHYHQPEMKRASKEWGHSAHQTPTKFCMLVLFWVLQGPLAQHYTSRGATVISTLHCNLLRNHLSLLGTVSCWCMTVLGHILLLQLRWAGTFIVSPSPDFTPCDYHIPGPLW